MTQLFWTRDELDATSSEFYDAEDFVMGLVVQLVEDMMEERIF
jgi:hypothetical protein